MLSFAGVLYVLFWFVFFLISFFFPLVVETFVVPSRVVCLSSGAYSLHKYIKKKLKEKNLSWLSYYCQRNNYMICFMSNSTCSPPLVINSTRKYQVISMVKRRASRTSNRQHKYIQRLRFFCFFPVVVEKFVVPLLVFCLSSGAYSVHQYIKKKEKKSLLDFLLLPKE